MKLSKIETKFLLQLILTWTIINIVLNMTGLFTSKLLNSAEFVYIDNFVKEFLKPVLIQTLLFGICLFLSHLLLKNKKWVNYTFVVLQAIIFHIIFFLGIKFGHGIHFATTVKSWGLQYLGYSGQYLIDVLYIYFPINGKFDAGMFMPSNIFAFYIHWILLNLVYYFGLTWLSLKTMRIMIKSESENAS